MRVLDHGHLYDLDTLDGRPGEAIDLRFVKRIGDEYPGNEGTPWSGTTTQEVLRALIHRTRYVNDQKDHPFNTDVVTNLRVALVLLEERAAMERGERDKFCAVIRAHCKTTGGPAFNLVEALPTCSSCGHIACERHAVEVAR